MKFQEAAASDISEIISETQSGTVVFSREAVSVSAPAWLIKIPTSITLQGIDQEVKGSVIALTVSVSRLAKVPGQDWSVKYEGSDYLILSPPDYNETLGIASYKLRKK